MFNTFLTSNTTNYKYTLLVNNIFPTTISREDIYIDIRYLPKVVLIPERFPSVENVARELAGKKKANKIAGYRMEEFLHITIHTVHKPLNTSHISSHFYFSISFLSSPILYMLDSNQLFYTNHVMKYCHSLEHTLSF